MTPTVELWNPLLSRWEPLPGPCPITNRQAETARVHREFVALANKCLQEVS